MARTLKRNPRFGAYVKEVAVVDTFLVTKDSYCTMYTILKLCLSIEIIFVEELRVTEILYPCLMQGRFELKYLKKFIVYDDGECHIHNVMGAIVFLTLFRTLRCLILRLEEASSSRISGPRCHFILKHIKKFVKLDIADFAETTDTVFGQLLDDWPVKVKMLKTDSFYMPEWDKPCISHYLQGSN